MKKSVVTYTCDRCGKEMKDSSGTLKYDKDSVEALLLITRNHFEENTQHIHYGNDLCDSCLSSLETWFSSDEYKRVESCWNIETDLPKLDLTIVKMATEIRHLRNCGDQVDIVNEFLDTAEELIRISNEKT